MGWIANPLFAGSNPVLHSKENKVKIREIVKRLEEIEQVSDEKSIELVTSLIDDIIEFDLHMEKLFDKITKDAVEQDMMEFLMEHGIESGSIGEA